MCACGFVRYPISAYNRFAYTQRDGSVLSICERFKRDWIIYEWKLIAIGRSPKKKQREFDFQSMIATFDGDKNPFLFYDIWKGDVNASVRRVKFG